MPLQNTPVQTYSLDDIEGLRELSLAQGWSHSLEDWRTILNSGPVFGHRSASGKVLSSASLLFCEAEAPSAFSSQQTKLPSGNRVAVLGMVIVDGEARRRGLGEQLVRHAIRLTENALPAMSLSLIATEMGRPLYEKLGFRCVEKLHKFVRAADQPRPTGIGDAAVGSLLAIDRKLVAPVFALDAETFGCRRERFLAQRVAQAETGVLLYEGEHAVGYGLLIRQNDLAILGPLVAPDDASALTILSALMRTTNTAFRIDLPARQNTFFTGLKALGFVEDDVPQTMLRGLDRLPGKRERYYAIAAQAFC